MFFRSIAVLLALSAYAGVGEASAVWELVPAKGKVVFWWTEDGGAITPPEERQNNTNEAKVEKFENPPANATDWRQWTEDKDGKRSDVFGGNIKKINPWIWEPLDTLPAVDWWIPDLFAVEPDLQTLYTAVNLDLYLTHNPWPLLSIGDLLSIADSKISGLQGIYLSSTEFTFDPNSENGFVGTAFNGKARIGAFHSSVPEPMSISLLGLGLACLPAFKRVRSAKTG
jgi:hypothetical protein